MLLWCDYYWRVIGFFLVLGGAGLMIEEAVLGGGWDLGKGIFQHEFYGIILIAVGSILIMGYWNAPKPEFVPEWVP